MIASGSILSGRASSRAPTRIAHVPVAVANLPVGHGGTFTQANGGDACGLCQDAQWSLQRKQFPAAAASR